MNLVAFVKLLWDTKVISMAPGVASLALIGYLQLFQIMPLQAQIKDVKEDVAALRIGDLQRSLDTAYTALCMNPGDPDVLERIRDLQQQYERVAGQRYNPPSCDLLIKLK